jgi:hypothetical protein
LQINSEADPGVVTISSSESDIYMVNSWTVYTGVKADWFNWLCFSNIDELGCAAGSPLGMFDLDCGVTQSSLIGLHAGREVPCGLCHIPAKMSTLSVSSTNVVDGGAQASSSFVCG